MTTPNKCKGTVHTTMCEGPNPQLQALIKKANDKRSLWTKTQDFFSGAWDGTKRIYEASKNDLGNTGIGFFKGIGNLPTDVWNLAVFGSKYVGPIPGALQADTLNYAAMQAYQGGDIATANLMASRASEMMEAGYASDFFEIKNDAQKGGSIASMIVPVGAVVKGVGAGAKIVRGSKGVDGLAILSKASRVSTKPNTAHFWSGRSKDASGKVHGGAQDAEKIARENGGKTLEMLIEERKIQMPNWDPNNPSATKAWENISAEYAAGASGEVRAVIGNELRPGNIWETRELPALMNNPNVTKIIKIDPATGAAIQIYP